MNITQAAATLGKKGGQVGTGKCKKRSYEHYQYAGKRSWEGRRLTTHARFWKLVKRGEPHECWPWTASVQHGGYGRFQLKKKTISAHRMAWELSRGVIPCGLCILHKCDNPRCCNPSHLFVGTFADNTKDMVNKGRKYVTFGERHSMHKVTAEQVVEIRNRYKRRVVSQAALAKEYGLTQTSIGRIVRRNAWKCIP